MAITTIYDDAVAYTKEHNGGTFLVGWRGQEINQLMPLHMTAHVYVLSVDDNLGRELPYVGFNTTSLTVFILNNQRTIRLWNERESNKGSLKAIGTWVDDHVYLDVVTIYRKDEYDLKTILEIARANKQRAIWDNEAQVAIETGWTP